MSEKELQNSQVMDETELEQVQGGAVVEKKGKEIDLPLGVDLALYILTAPLPGPALVSTTEALVNLIFK